jgi:hypothetical protein
MRIVVQRLFRITPLVVVMALVGCVIAPKDTVVQRFGLNGGHITCLVESTRSIGAAYPTTEGPQEDTRVVNRTFSVWTAAVTDKQFRRTEIGEHEYESKVGSPTFAESSSIEHIREINLSLKKPPLPDPFALDTCVWEGAKHVCLVRPITRESEGICELRNYSGELLNQIWIPVEFTPVAWDVKSHQLLFLNGASRNARLVEMYLWAYSGTGVLTRVEIQRP